MNAAEVTALSTVDERRRWSLRRRLAVSFGVLGALLAIGVLAGVLAASRLFAASTEVVDDVSPARIRSAMLGQTYGAQQLAVRDYVLSGTENRLERYQAERNQEFSTLTRLRELLDGRTELLSKVDTVEAAARRWQRELAEPAIAQVRQNGASGALLGGLDYTEPRFVALQESLTKLDSAVGAQRLASKAAMERALWVLTGLGIGFVAFALVCAVVLWFALRRWVTGPLHILGEETTRVAQGDLARQVGSDGPQEIAALAADIEAMRVQMFTALMTAVRVQETLREQAQQLAESAEELRRSNAELEQFAYVASHDLQEPLRKVASFCQLLQRRYGGQLDARADQYIEFAVDGAKRMQQLINDMLAFSRVGRAIGEFTPVELTQALERARTSLTAAREETGAVIESDPLPRVLGNLTLLAQVLQNLLGNAIKFRGQDTPLIRISVERHGAEWLFRCADNGIGIEPQYAEKIFVMFQRLHAKADYTGTGIGLALCRKIIEHHGGRIWLDTEVRAGTTVCWTLPALAEESA
ncbi:sensor histidine kinase [Crossiella cryophila]|uniref:histidine kinase n=1 Tax=Crossiella cryophila TaxID=43355 RepID=A0A7W7FXS0_9PSEU|nr:ATP-binding protein [Crossiella cryophila]MBB4681607.1 signal transduction histidine kinase [Crossiella cryophila]